MWETLWHSPIGGIGSLSAGCISQLYFSNCISQLYLLTVFFNCIFPTVYISQQYLLTVFFSCIYQIDFLIQHLSTVFLNYWQHQKTLRWLYFSTISLKCIFKLCFSTVFLTIGGIRSLSADCPVSISAHMSDWCASPSPPQKYRSHKIFFCILIFFT